jgi:drug/metabolite transporter (DMT)-like permease
LAVVSGAGTSGLGYILWYFVLKELKTSTAAIVQLSVPVISALAGILILGENMNIRLAIAGILILSGIIIKVSSGKLSV